MPDGEVLNLGTISAIAVLRNPHWVESGPGGWSWPSTKVSGGWSWKRADGTEAKLRWRTNHVNGGHNEVRNAGSRYFWRSRTIHWATVSLQYTVQYREARRVQTKYMSSTAGVYIGEHSCLGRSTRVVPPAWPWESPSCIERTDRVLSLQRGDRFRGTDVPRKWRSVWLGTLGLLRSASCSYNESAFPAGFPESRPRARLGLGPASIKLAPRAALRLLDLKLHSIR